ncbi:hypothetical protein [Nonlabens dokdonensis]|uniref:hypothetical protein n=1 Tax=Nonlabens dokdonensis TaxID=328515 RepID=UPI0026F2059F|nr:hypothetical protein [Nonlabens dokdonensis]
MKEKDWYSYDTRWDLYAKDREDFVAKFVVEGKFHEGVPEDVIKSFETVSYLLAHSYYHWPMMDEAMTKLLLILEMVVKLKAQELEISLERKTKNNKIITRRLIEIIDDIFQNEYLLFLKPDFDRARNLRNMKMHPDRHSFMGAMGFTDSNARLFVNIINLLFLETDKLKALHSKIKSIEATLQPFKSGLHILEFQNKKILIDGFHMFKYREFNKNKLLMMYINPLTTKVHEQFLEHKYPEPLIITFTDFIINDNSIEGVDLNGKLMKIYSNEKEENLKVYQKYLFALSKISEIEIGIFSSSNASKALWKIERIIYENCWKDGSLINKESKN